jgi:hypothetical protein
MKWLERSGFVAVGSALAFGVVAAAGRVTLGGDFLANIAGATIGGTISVGLAVMMFTYQRKIAGKDAEEASKRNWTAAVRESLRYVRAIREAVEAGRGITINNGAKLSAAIAQSAALTKRALQDVNLTDFHLRLAMEEAALIGDQISQTLPGQLSQAGLADANTLLPSANLICDPALRRLDELIADYTRIRNLPVI